MKNLKIDLKNKYLELPEHFYHKNNPKKVPQPKLQAWNLELAPTLGIIANLESDRDYLEQVFSGNLIIEGTQPLSMAYSGHQFGHFNPDLGDGRAHLLGELMGSNGQSYDIQLKGSGQSRYSRRGDGLSALGPVIREYLVSEAMYSLGVPTTRSLAIVESSLTVERASTLKAGILTRVAESHIRVGHFQYLANQEDVDGINRLIDYTLEKSYPDLMLADNKPLALFKAVVEKQAFLVSQWMSLGFIHGVMNTDNTSVSGITIDYGPCAFLDETNFEKVFSSIDRSGRYAYNRQPQIQQWNLAQLAEVFLTVYSESEQSLMINKFTSELENYTHLFEKFWGDTFLKKIGIDSKYSVEGAKVLSEWIKYFNFEKIDFTLGFRELSTLLDSENRPSVFKNIQAYQSLIENWKKIVLRDSNANEVKLKMNAVNPQIIPRNHNIEAIIQSCYKGDWSMFHRFEKVLRTPFVLDQDKAEFIQPPQPNEIIACTFCGT